MSRLYPSDSEVFIQAGTVIKNGGIVGFPTETYYGLAVDPWNKKALQRLFSLKRRPAQSPVLVLVPSIQFCQELTETTPNAVFRALAAEYWPGPLTLVCKAKDSVPVELTGGTGTIGMRQSPHPIAEELVRQAGPFITATSANISGHPPATNARQVEQYFEDGVDLIIDGGQTPGEKGSTLIRCDLHPVVCIREGQIPFSSIPRELLH